MTTNKAQLISQTISELRSSVAESGHSESSKLIGGKLFEPRTVEIGRAAKALGESTTKTPAVAVEIIVSKGGEVESRVLAVDDYEANDRTNAVTEWTDPAGFFDGIEVGICESGPFAFDDDTEARFRKLNREVSALIAELK